MSVTDEFTKDELADMFQFLDDLRSSGVTNMFGAAPHVQRQYGLSDDLAKKVATAWMQTFSTKTDLTQRVDQLMSGRTASW